MKKIRKWFAGLAGLLFCAAWLLNCTVPAVAAKQPQQPMQTLTSLIRFTPKSDSTPIGQLENGAAVTVLRASGSFYEIDCYDMTGYIAKSQVEKTADGEYYVNCKAESSETRVLTYTAPAEALKLQHDLLATAKEQLGSRYVYGGERPGAFDCSGLTSYLYKQHGIRIQRRASLQLQEGIIVPKEAMQVGDLVFFREHTKNPASHVGIYAGDGKIIHASTSSGVEYASLDSSYYETYFLCARRVINTATTLTPMPVARGIETALTVNSVSGRSVR